MASKEWVDSSKRRDIHRRRFATECMWNFALPGVISRYFLAGARVRNGAGWVLMMLLAMASLCDTLGAQGVPGAGDTIVLRGIRVTFLGAKRLSEDEYRAASGPLYRGWIRDGLRLAFLVENRQDAPVMPALGDIRVIIALQQYNAVVNSSSRDRLAPFVIVREPGAFLSTSFGQTLRERLANIQSRPSNGILDVFIRGDAIPQVSPGFVELQQGETHINTVDGKLRRVLPSERLSSWIPFRFELPPLK